MLLPRSTNNNSELTKVLFSPPSTIGGGEFSYRARQFYIEGIGFGVIMGSLLNGGLQVSFEYELPPVYFPKGQEYRVAEAIEDIEQPDIAAVVVLNGLQEAKKAYVYRGGPTDSPVYIRQET